MIFQWYFKTKIPNFQDNYKRYKTEKHRTTYYTWSLHTSYDYYWVFLRKSVKSSYSPSEECVKQHYMVVCDFSAHIPRVKKRKFSPRIWTWKLRDPTTATLFQSAFKLKTMTAAAAIAIAPGADADTANHVESDWSKLKGPLLDAATEVCRGWQCYIYYIREGSMVQASMPWTKEAWRRGPKTAYIDAKRMAKHAVWLAKSEVEKEKFTIVSPDGDGVFRIAKQMDCRKQDITGENCAHNDAGELALTDENQLKAWVEHYAGLLKVEFVWPSNGLPQVTPNDGPPPSMSATQIGKALSKMKCSRAAGQSQLMLKAAGEEGVELTKKLTKAVFSCCAIPSSLWGELHNEPLCPIRAKVKTLTVAIIVVSNWQIKSWSCWNGY